MGLKGTECAVHSRYVIRITETNVDFNPRLSGDHIALGSATDYARIHGKASTEIGKGADGFKLPRQLIYRAVSALEIYPAVSRQTSHGKSILAHRFPCRFVCSNF